MAPAATLATVGDRWAERCRGSTTPVTPAHSALRSSEPRLWGSVMPSRTSRNGTRPRREGSAQGVERGLLDGPGQGHHALGGVGAGHRVDPAAGHVLDPHPPGGGQRLDLVEDGGGVHPLGHEERRHRPPVGLEQLAHRLAALDLVAAQSAGPDDLRARGTGVDRLPLLGVPPRRPHSRPASRCPARSSHPTSPVRSHPVPASPGPRRAWRAHRASPSAPGAGHAASSTTAVQAIPSARPRAPSPSARVAFTLTGAPSTSPSRSAIRST